MKSLLLGCALIACAAASTTYAGDYPQQTAVDQNTGQLVTFDVINGHAYLDDIGLGRIEDIERDGLFVPQPLSPLSLQVAPGRAHRKDGFQRGAIRWQLPIPYVVSSPELEGSVSTAIAALSAQTAARFVRRTTEPDYIAFTIDPATLTGGCYSEYFGQSPYGGKQQIATSPSGCTGPQIEHEIMHAMGFAHEHQRSDRDRYIQVHLDCVNPAQKYNYAVSNTVSFGAYDFSSLMHYSAVNGFSVSPGCATFVVKPGLDVEIKVPSCPGMDLPIGQRCGLSAGDIAAINYYYGPNPPHITNLEINQRGITGSWYQPATSGQGVELEVFPNAAGANTGVLQGSWFTFDTTAGGFDRERWYTFGGSVPGGQDNGTFALYQNVGGNFNAAPATVAAPIGTVKLAFSDCSNGTMSYSLTDGSNRNGTINLTRLLSNVSCVLLTDAVTPKPDFGYSGNWYDPAASGQGITIELNPVAKFLFLAWYTYAPTGQSIGVRGQRWYTGQAYYTVGSRVLNFNLFETTGGAFNSSTPPAQTLYVGTATLWFRSCSAASLNYRFDYDTNAGLAGNIQLSRVGPVPADCVN